MHVYGMAVEVLERGGEGLGARWGVQGVSEGSGVGGGGREAEGEAGRRGRGGPEHVDTLLGARGYGVDGGGGAGLGETDAEVVFVGSGGHE